MRGNYLYKLATGESRDNASLNWLIRNGHRVVKIDIYERENGGGKMIAVLNERGVPVEEFRSVFASFAVLQKWINRPSLSGAVKHKHFRSIK